MIISGPAGSDPSHSRELALDSKGSGAFSLRPDRMSMADKIALENSARWTAKEWAVHESRLSERETGPSEARTARAASLESPSLDSSSPSWRITQRDFGDKIVEVRGVFVAGAVRMRSPRETVERIVAAEAGEEKKAWRRARCRREMRWRCLCLKADHMLTLTKRGKFAVIDDAWDAWKNFLKSCRKEFAEAFEYVVVPEQHKDGSWHLHVAVHGRWDVRVLRRFWQQALGGEGGESGAYSLGNIDAKSFVGPQGNRVVAKYMSKYMGKALDARGPKRRAYASSKGLTAKIEKWSEPVEANTVPIYRIIERLQVQFGGEYEVFEWQESGMSGFIIKTRGT